jgi:CelD/BcsL family acetyltransferase involved in cellulose biosynthesis
MHELELVGGRLRLAATPAEAERASACFAELHPRHWRDAQEPSYLDAGWFAATREAAISLAPRGELRLWTMELEGRTAAVQMYLASNGVWNPSAARRSPAILTKLAAIKDAFERGERRCDLCGGPHPYKLRLATDDAPVVCGGLVPDTRRYPLVRAGLAPQQVRYCPRPLTRRLSPRVWSQLKRLLRQR